MPINLVNFTLIIIYKTNHLNKYKYILLFTLIGLYTTSFAQKTVTFEDQIIELNALGKQILSSEIDADKYKANSVYKSALKTLIETPSSFETDFSALTTISILQENNLKIYNWVILLSDDTYEYFAFFQIKTDKDQFRIVELIDKSESIESPETRILTNKNWYGAIYYKLIYSKYLGKDKYTLLGWDGNNLLTNKKLIDVVTTSAKGIIRFGAPIFKTEKKTKKRVIFEYSSDVAMSLKYHSKIGKIVFDVLIPSSSSLKGVYEYYGPTLDTFDALFIENKKWNYEKNIQIKLDPSFKDQIWKKPEKVVIR